MALVSVNRLNGARASRGRRRAGITIVCKSSCAYVRQRHRRIGEVTLRPYAPADGGIAYSSATRKIAYLPHSIDIAAVALA